MTNKTQKFNYTAINDAFNEADENFQRFNLDMDAISADIRGFEEMLSERKIHTDHQMEIGTFFGWDEKQQIEDYEAVAPGITEYLAWGKINGTYRLLHKETSSVFRFDVLNVQESARRVTAEDFVQLKPLIDTKAEVRKRLFSKLPAFVVEIGKSVSSKNLDFTEYDHAAPESIQEIPGQAPEEYPF